MTARRVLFSLLLVFFCVTPLALAQTQNLSATARVSPTPSDFQFLFQSSDPQMPPIPQGHILTYTIDYGSHIGNAVPITLTASWSRGTVAGDSAPSVDIAEYVLGSATPAQNNTPAVIDTINRTITWTIAAFPADTTNKTVSFQLVTTDNFTGEEEVSFTVTAQMHGDGIAVGNIIKNQTYLFDPAIVTPTPTPSPTPLPTAIPTPNPTSQPGNTPTPTPGSSSEQPTATPTLVLPQIPLAFSEIYIRTIQHTQASAAIRTTQPTILTVSYGLSPQTMTQKITTTSYAVDHLLRFSNLLPNTKYYFQIHAVASTQSEITSDIFTVMTSHTALVPTVDLQTVLINAANKSMINNTTTTPPTVMLPANTPYEIQFTFTKDTPVRHAQIILRDKSVLGIFTTLFSSKTQAKELMTDMVEIRENVFLARGISPMQPGEYTILVRITDYNGNITEEAVGKLLVSRKFTVVNTDEAPIENARIYLLVYRTETKTYEPIGNHSIENPTFTNMLGESSLVLPPGKYKARVSALGYTTKDVTFRIGTSLSSDGYPLVKLTSEAFTLLTLIQYLHDGTTDIGKQAYAFMSSLAYSTRVFNITALTVLLFTICITFLAFFTKTHTHPKVGIQQLGYMLHHVFDTHAKKHYIVGTVTDKKLHLPLSQVRVFVIDDNTKNVLYETVTNKKGSFLLKKPLKHYHVMAVKNGFEAAILYPNMTDVLYIMMHANTHHAVIKTSIWYTFTSIVAMLFESLLILTVILEVFLTDVFTLEKTWPFITLSVLNILLWCYYLSLKHHREI